VVPSRRFKQPVMYLRRLLRFRHYGRFVALGAVALVTACADSALPPAPVDRVGAGSMPAGASVDRTYRIGIGDKVKVAVFGEADLSGTFEVNTLGQIPLPLAGEITARGLTIGELKERVVARLSQGFLKHPKVSVEILNYRPIYVHGEVRNGGEFAYKTGVKLRDAVAMAGGFTYRANTSYVLLARDGREMRVDLPSEALLLPGDNIRVPERFF
jgi:protein involved in polysaccharide export with SLBB domain